LWYSNTTGAIAGTLEEYDFSQFIKTGGELICLDTLAQEDEQLAVITSEGVCFLYSGTDPADSANWYKRGVYQIPRPIGYRSTCRIAGDLVVITQEGYFNLSRVLSVQTSNKAVAFSDKISKAVKDLSAKFDNLGWQIKFYSKGSFLIVNTPQGISIYNQHIMNTTTGMWCRWTGLNGYCFETFNDNLYFAGANGNVYQADYGQDDDGNNIEGYVQQAFSNFGVQSIKKWCEILPLISANANLALNIYFGIDFSTPSLAAQASPTGSPSTPWGSPWGSTWGRGATILQKRIPLIANIGYKGSIGIKIKSKQSDTRWYSTIVVFEAGRGVK
jgi:hypothetical protein